MEVSMKTSVLVMALSLLLSAGLAQAQWRGGVFVYDPEGPRYQAPSRDYRYDPRSPYPYQPHYRPNLPPRYDGRLPPRYYDRHAPGRLERYPRRADRFPPHRSAPPGQWRPQQPGVPHWQRPPTRDYRTLQRGYDHGGRYQPYRR